MRSILLLAALTACALDETISGYADPAATYVLAEIDRIPVAARTTIRFPEEGRIIGDAPCNSFSADQTAPYPWFAPGPVAVTRIACPDLVEETRVLATLSEMTFAEVSGDVVILTNGAGREMVFRREASPP
jgi:heat shock protein HslJ